MNNYPELLKNITQLMDEGRSNIAQTLSRIMIQTYWEIGKNLVEYEQKGNERAEYGSKLLNQLSKDLKTQFGKGFSQRNIYQMRLFFTKYPILQTSAKFQISETLSHQLSWSHYVELLKIEDNLERSFYEKECEKEKAYIPLMDNTIQ